MDTIFRDYYLSPSTRRVCHEVKECGSGIIYKEAVDTIASSFINAGILREGDILIPAPQHTGRATYMKEIAEIVALSTNSCVCDILLRNKGARLYGMTPRDRADALEMYLKNDNIPKGRLYFLDNVVSTGTTYEKAKDLIGDDLKLMAFAVDYRRYKKGGIQWKKNRKGLPLTNQMNCSRSS